MERKTQYYQDGKSLPADSKFNPKGFIFSVEIEKNLS